MSYQIATLAFSFIGSAVLNLTAMKLMKRARYFALILLVSFFANFFIGGRADDGTWSGVALFLFSLNALAAGCVGLLTGSTMKIAYFALRRYLD